MVIGHLGRDPEMRYTPSGRPVTNFNVATSRTWKTSDNERRTETEWFNVVAWGSLAEICNQYLTKGQQVYIEGRLQTRRWEEDGVHRSTVEIVAKEMVMLGKRKQKDQDQGQEDIEDLDTDLDHDESDEFPF